MKKKKVLIGIIIIVIIFAFAMVKIIYEKNNLVHISEENKKELMRVLEIEDAPSFKPISKRSLLISMPGSASAFELKFEISIEDYEKNNLKYQDKDTDELDIHYKIKKNENTYLCIIRASTQNEYTTKLYKEILNALE